MTTSIARGLVWRIEEHVVEGGRQLTRVLGRALDANLRYNAALGELALRTFDLLVSAVSEIGPQIVSTTTRVQEASTTMPIPPGLPSVPSPAPILLEGEAGGRAFGLFVVENNLPQQLSARVEVGPLVDPNGREIKAVLRFKPGVITLAPKEQVVARVSARISRGLIAGVRYQGEIRVPGIAGARIPIVVRRKPTGNSKASASRVNRASSISKGKSKHPRGHPARNVFKG
jgi:hypothetical protein